MGVKLAGSEPIKSAMVRLRKADDQNQGYVAITDGGGHFELKQVEAGRYRLEVSRSGFVTQQFGPKTPDDPGALLTLSPGEKDRKSTRLNSSHQIISYAVFCLKKKKPTPSPRNPSAIIDTLRD